MNFIITDVPPFKPDPFTYDLLNVSLQNDDFDDWVKSMADELIDRQRTADEVICQTPLSDG